MEEQRKLNCLIINLADARIDCLLHGGLLKGRGVFEIHKVRGNKYEFSGVKCGTNQMGY